MTANTTAQIATFLNVSPNQIKSVTEMAWVYCVVVRGRRARFVSKKVVKTEEKEMLFLSLEEAQKIIGDPEAIERGYVTEKSVNAAIQLATELKANGFEARDGMAIFPNVWHISEPIKAPLSKREQTVLSALAAHLMSV